MGLLALGDKSGVTGTDWDRSGVTGTRGQQWGYSYQETGVG